MKEILNKYLSSPSNILLVVELVITAFPIPDKTLTQRRNQKLWHRWQVGLFSHKNVFSLFPNPFLLHGCHVIHQKNK